MNRSEQSLANGSLIQKNDPWVVPFQSALRHSRWRREGIESVLIVTLLTCLSACLRLSPVMAATRADSAAGDNASFSVLYRFPAPAPVTFTSLRGSQPDTTPALGPGNTVYGMTYHGGANGTGTIFAITASGAFTVLHTFSALGTNGVNEDGAYPGNGLTQGPGDVFYGMASDGGANGTGTIFAITASGAFTVLHTFSALDANGNNEDGAYPLQSAAGHCGRQRRKPLRHHPAWWAKHLYAHFGRLRRRLEHGPLG